MQTRWEDLVYCKNPNWFVQSHLSVYKAQNTFRGKVRDYGADTLRSLPPLL
jgi:hypothetical protein